MVIDSSALIAIVRDETQGERFRGLMRDAFPRLVAAPTAVKASVVMLSRFGEAGLSDLQELLTDTSAQVAPFTQTHVGLAIDAFRRFGKGRHPAGLNLGDCFAYALSQATGQPLLFKGEDFARTDVKRAV